ncbi:hypothetical protein JOF48_000323 [Arthrobacter stackebrandtii]|uniref:Glycosyltransferase n=1 Tax=Arthrobacter stackebrandtii TaxID=272161 RepID=A0ABS4YS02_9MICC|nr:hypothetical protein [Arthrobacter stackebrandtii]MBP2411524.1 hypothetical protein [Arthrobacter stackebrandtii]
MSVGLNNPLPEALRHYQTELIETLDRVSVVTKISANHPVENITGRLGAAHKLYNVVRNSRARRALNIPTIQLWPSMGLLEPLLWKTSSNNRHSIIYHDPVPIRKQIGFDCVSEMIAHRINSSKSPRLLVHSPDAESELAKLFPRMKIEMALHPVLSEMKTSSVGAQDIIVAGQFKPERDLNLLSAIGPQLKNLGLRPRIFGRGWPDTITGWEIDSRYLSENELDQRIDAAAIVLIPYKNYFQSGIAIRALERGRPVVSPENSFTKLIFGHVDGAVYPADSPPEQVVAHIKLVMSSQYQALATFSRYRDQVDRSWHDLMYEG